MNISWERWRCRQVCRWSLTSGHDFDVSRASAPDGKSRVSVYLGYYGFLSRALEPGNFAGVRVRWYRLQQESGEPIELFAFVESYKHASCHESINIQPTVAADDEATLQLLVRSLAQVKIIGPGCSEPHKRNDGGSLKPVRSRDAVVSL